MTKSLICGGKGYLGNNFSTYLSSLNINFDIENFKKVNDFDLKRYVSRIDFSQYQSIYWFIGKNSPNESYANNYEYVTANIMLPSLTIEELVNQKFDGQFNFISTRLVYNNVISDAKEVDSNYNEVKSPYALAKQYIEKLLSLYGEREQINSNILRLGVPYGSINGQTFGLGTIGAFQKQAKDGIITLFGDGSQKRTFTHIVDLFEALLQLQLGNSGCNTYNIHGETLTLKKVATLIAERYNAKLKYVPYPKHAFLIESGDTQFDFSKLTEFLGRGPSYQFEEWSHKLD